MIACSLAGRIWLAGVAPAIAVALHVAPAWASETFPARIQKDLGLEQKPDCILCHETEKGEKNTVTRAFGKSMRKAGLAAGSLGSLDAALQKLEKDGTDSDGDDVPDIDELRMGRNPNAREIVTAPPDAGPGDAAAPQVIVVEEPPPAGPPLMETGCLVAPLRRSTSASLLVAGLGLVALSVRRRHRPRFAPSRAARHSH
jgi:hypothetical protein